MIRISGSEPISYDLTETPLNIPDSILLEKKT